MNYEEMTDFEINKAVAVVFGGSHEWLEGCFCLEKGPSVKLCICCMNSVELPDYCNNPSDAWPIITENRISIFSLSEGHLFIENEWLARNQNNISKDKNGLRAAMIVFLMMKDDEQ